MSDVRTHFSKAKAEIQFPEWLLYHRYILDEWESKLISPDHTKAERRSSVDLRYWDNLHDVMNVIKKNDIQRGNGWVETRVQMGNALPNKSLILGRH